MGSPLDTSLFFNQPLTGITPFTYRDNETYLERLNRIQCYFSDQIQVLQNNIASVEAQDLLAIQTLASQLNDVITNFVNTWQNEILALQDQSPLFVFDPTNGSRTETANVVIGRIYDNLRIYAYFANQLDAFNLTAAEWDAFQYTARGFDLALAYTDTTINATDTAITGTPIHIS